MSEQCKLSTDEWFPVVLLDDTDFKAGETGKAVGDLTVEYKKLGGGAGWTAYSPAAGNWQEHGDGEYGMQMGASEFSSTGRWQVHVQCTGCLTFRFSVDVTTLSKVEESTEINKLTGADAGTGTAGSIIEEIENRATPTQVNAEVDTALADINLDHLLAVADSDDVANDSVIAKIVDKAVPADWSNFNNAQESITAINDNIGVDGAGLTELASQSSVDTIDGIVDDILADTADMQPKLGTPDQGTISGDIGVIENGQSAMQVDVTTIDTKIGFPVNIDLAGATLADNLHRICDDDGGTTYNATQDSLRERGDVTGANQNDIEAKIDTIISTGSTGPWTTGSGGDATEAKQDTILSKLLKYVQLMYRSDSQIATDNATELAAINADEGSGGGNVLNTTDALQAGFDQRNDIDSSLTDARNELGAVDNKIDIVDANVDTIVGKLPATNYIMGSSVSSGLDDEIQATYALAQDMQPRVVAIEADTADMQPKIGTPTDTDLATDIANLSTKVDNIGSASGGALNFAPTDDNYPVINETLDASPAVDKGSGQVGIPITAHGFSAGQEVTIAGTTNYDGSYDIQSETANEIVIEATYNAETFAGTETADHTLGGEEFVGVQTSGTWDSVQAEDGVYHQITHVGNAINIAYRVPVGGARTAVEILWKGRLVSLNDNIIVKAWNGTSWDSVYNFDGQSNLAPTGTTDNATEVIPLLGKHTNNGEAWLLFTCTAQSAPVLYTDQLLVSAVSIGQSVGYANGQIWINTTGGGSAGQEEYVNGTADNPSNNLPDALALSVSLGIASFNISPGSTVDLIAEASGMVGIGKQWNLGLESQLINSSYIQGAIVSGNADPASTGAEFDHCELGTLGATPGHFHDCAITDIITALAAGTYMFDKCYSGIAGSATPTWDFGAAIGSTALNMRNYSGGIEIENMQAGDTMSLEGRGQLVINANCTGGAISMRGNFGPITGLTAFLSAGGTLTDLGNITSLQGLSADIQSRLPAALISGKMDSDVRAINGSTNEAERLQQALLATIKGAVSSTTLSATSLIIKDLTNSGADMDNADVLKNRVLIFTSGLCRGQAIGISAHTASAAGPWTLTVTTMVNFGDIAVDDTFVIV